MAEKKYYWLKLQKDFFKRHDIKIIKAMPNGKDYVIFYLTLLLESLNHDGELRFSDTIPYNEEMLSVVTDTNIDIVRSAMKILTELKMVEILEDSTIFMTEINKMLGCETKWAEKKRLYRQKNQCTIEDKTKTFEDNVRQEKEIEIEIEKEIEIDKDIDIIGYKPQKSKRFIPPTVEEVKKYCRERNNNVDAERFINFYSAKGWKIGKNSMKDWKASVRTWEQNKLDAKNKTEVKRDYEIKVDKDGGIF